MYASHLTSSGARANHMGPVSPHFTVDSNNPFEIGYDKEQTSKEPDSGFQRSLVKIKSPILLSEITAGSAYPKRMVSWNPKTQKWVGVNKNSKGNTEVTKLGVSGPCTIERPSHPASPARHFPPG